MTSEFYDSSDEEHPIAEIRAEFERDEDGQATVVATLGGAKVTLEWGDEDGEAMEIIISSLEHVLLNVQAAVKAQEASEEE